MQCVEIFRRHTMTSDHRANVDGSHTTRVKSARRSVVTEVVAVKKPVVRMMETDIVHFQKIADGDVARGNISIAVAGYTCIAPFFLERVQLCIKSFYGRFRKNHTGTAGKEVDIYLSDHAVVSVAADDKEIIFIDIVLSNILFEIVY